MTGIEAVLLGTAQDAGLPQSGCRCVRCSAARQDSKLVRFPVSLAIIDHAEGAFWLIDSTPAMPFQLDHIFRIFPNYELAGLFLTHAHAGHYPGLIHFGKEGWNTDGLALYASERMQRFLTENQPWGVLLRDNFRGTYIRAGKPVRLTSRLVVEAVEVPHRAEYTDTFAYRVASDQADLVYCPDIDGWEDFDTDRLFAGADHALVDGTFFSADELPGRDLRTIPHPLVSDSIHRLAGYRCRFWFIHLNHSNPLHDAGPERAIVEAAGFGIAEQWQSWRLGR